jgi:hydroxyacylglutathione hydrolase
MQRQTIGGTSALPRATAEDLTSPRPARFRRGGWFDRGVTAACSVVSTLPAIPLHELPRRLGDLPDDPIWVHCQAGYRAIIAASILHAAGRTVTAVDDDFMRAAEAGLR